jgi:hypothetical protein
MLKRVAALLMILLFAGQALAGGIVCGIDAISNRFSQVDEAACSMQDESTGGSQLGFAPQILILAPPVVTLRLVSLDALGQIEASDSLVSVRSADNSLLHHEPPDLFLSNSTFLI